MRLIDADEITYETMSESIGDGMYIDVDMAYRGDIELLNEIEAIPVEWIEAYAKEFDKGKAWFEKACPEYTTNSNYINISYLQISIRTMIGIWRKEHDNKPA